MSYNILRKIDGFMSKCPILKYFSPSYLGNLTTEDVVNEWRLTQPEKFRECAEALSELERKGEIQKIVAKVVELGKRQPENFRARSKDVSGKESPTLDLIIELVRGEPRESSVTSFIETTIRQYGQYYKN